jgi:hypothetical protein
LAVKVCIEPIATLGFDGVTVTETGPVELPPPPHPETPKKASNATASGAKNLYFVRISVLHFINRIFDFLNCPQFQTRRTQLAQIALSRKISKWSIPVKFSSAPDS